MKYLFHYIALISIPFVAYATEITPALSAATSPPDVSASLRHDTQPPSNVPQISVEHKVPQPNVDIAIVSQNYLSYFISLLNTFFFLSYIILKKFRKRNKLPHYLETLLDTYELVPLDFDIQEQVDSPLHTEVSSRTKYCLRPKAN